MSPIRLSILLLAIFACSSEAQPYKDRTLPVERRVEDLLTRMTPEEKFWQLFMLSGTLEDGPAKYVHSAFGFQLRFNADSVGAAGYADQIQRHFVEKTRLGIPVIFFEEALHGLAQQGTTSYPQAIALAATFDTTLMHEVAAAIAEDCRSRGIRQVLSPVVNIANDVRWGRTEETYGEDPFLTSAMGVAFVSEFEKRNIISTPKHFVANVGDGGRDSYPIHFNERLLREIYLPPFEACIRRGGAQSIMTSYNSLDGSPASANHWLNNQYLKEELGFDGFVISDAGAVGGANVLHFTARDNAESGERSLKSGLDVIFQTAFDHADLFIAPFLDGRIPPDVIDSAVGRVLRAKFELGLFDDPYVSLGVSDSTRAERGRALARRAAQESMVLLKNDATILPISQVKSIAVIGPDADEVRLGGYSGPGNHPVSILDGIRSRAGKDIAVRYAKGCSRLDTNLITVPASAILSASGGVAHQGFLAAYYDNPDLVGKWKIARIDPQLQFQWSLFSPDPEKLPFDCYSVRWTSSLLPPASGKFKIGIEGNDGYRLFLDDSLVLDRWRTVSYGTRVIDYKFVKNEVYHIRVDYREPAGNGRIRLVWNCGLANDTEAQIKSAVSTAKACDRAIVVVGLEEGEFRDRASLALPGHQEELIRRVAATGTPTVVVLVGGSAITMNSWIDSIDAVLDVWYSGEAGGEAVADVLFGDVNPAGRLPVTFPMAEGQLPLVYNHKPTGRGDDYYDMTGQPLFPFGFGLSYTEFAYSDLSISPAEVGITDTAVISFTLTNVGSTSGDEVVQFYLRDRLASVARPVQELKGFQRVHLNPGESKILNFAITPDLLTMLDAQLKPTIEPGEFRIMIGASSRDIRLHGTLVVRQ